jgi:hypothetical protein
MANDSDMAPSYRTVPLSDDERQRMADAIDALGDPEASSADNPAASTPLAHPIDVLEREGVLGVVELGGQAARKVLRHARRRAPVTEVLDWIKRNRPKRVAYGSILAVLAVFLVLGALVAGLFLLPNVLTHSTAQGEPSSTATSTVEGNPTDTVSPTGTTSATAGPTPTLITGNPGVFPTPTHRPGSLPTPTPRPTTAPGQPTATPDPHAGTATATFTDANDTQTSSAAMTACSSGCTIGDTVVNHSANYSAKTTFSSSRQVALQGSIEILNTTSSTFTGATVTINWQGGPSWANCGNIGVPSIAGGSAWTFTCTVYTSSGSVSAGSANFAGTCFGCSSNHSADIQWWAKTSFYWLAQVSDNDCHANGLTALENNTAGPALRSYFSNALSGQVIAYGPSLTYSNFSCSPGVGGLSQSETVSLTGAISGSGYAASAAQNAARTRLNGLIEPGYAWRSQTTCTPQTVSVTPSAININCAENGVEAFVWDSSHENGLANAMANQSKSSAQATCNGTAGVQSGSCSVSVQGGNGSTMPSSGADIGFVIN